MPALASYAPSGSSFLHQLERRRPKNFATRQPGIILVFCIVGTVALLLIFLFSWRKVQARRAARL